MARAVIALWVLVAFAGAQTVALAHGPHDHAACVAHGAGDDVPAPCGCSGEHEHESPAPSTDEEPSSSDGAHDCAICKVAGLASVASLLSTALPAAARVETRPVARAPARFAAEPLPLWLARGPPSPTGR